MGSAAIEKIENLYLLTDVFGRFPNFHDAEVLSFNTYRNFPKRSGPFILSSIYVFEMTPETDESGRYILKNKSVVTFRFDKVCELLAKGFNHQNMLQELIVKSEAESALTEVIYKSCVGLEASFKCENIRIEMVEPYIKENYE